VRSRETGLTGAAARLHAARRPVRKSATLNPFDPSTIRKGDVVSLRVWCCAVLGLSASIAQAEPWLCTDADGNRYFSYEPASAARKDCVHHPIPSPNTVRVAPSRTPARPDRAKAGRSEPKRADFPAVDARTQSRRDAERRAILERELAKERKALDRAIQELAENRRLLFGPELTPGRAEEKLKPYADRIRLHLTNIQSLEEELGRTAKSRKPEPAARLRSGLEAH
jgi:hypothetical protein